MNRDNLIPDTLYKIMNRKTEPYFYTPDGIGGYWYESLADAFEAVGERPFCLIPSLED